MSAAEYRLRAYERQWFEVMDDLQHLGDGVPLDNALRWLLSGGAFGLGTRPDPDPDAVGESDGLVRVFLLKEATEWIRLGQDVGYFDPHAEPAPVVLALRGSLGGLSALDLRSALPAWTDLANRLAGRGVVDASRSQEQFAAALMLADEDVVEQRVEHLRLIFFAAEAEWQRSLAQVRDLVGLLSRMRDPVLDDAVVDQVRWALSGSESVIDVLGMPSDWRTYQSVLSTARGSEFLKVQDELRQALVLHDAAGGRAGASAHAQQEEREAGRTSGTAAGGVQIIGDLSKNQIDMVLPPSTHYRPMEI